jgi:hypothetical protein
MFIKTIDKNGKIEHINWKNNFNAIRKKLNVEYPGYIVHEVKLYF